MLINLRNIFTNTLPRIATSRALPYSRKNSSATLTNSPWVFSQFHQQISQLFFGWLTLSILCPQGIKSCRTVKYFPRSIAIVRSVNGSIFPSGPISSGGIWWICPSEPTNACCSGDSGCVCDDSGSDTGADSPRTSSDTGVSVS